MKFGRNRPRVVHPHLKLKNYLKASLPAAPPSVSYAPAASAVLSDIFGNDTLGDCVIAAGYHVVGVETGNAGDLFHASADQIIADYSAIGGYVPGDPSTDQGCNVQTALAYWQTHGFANGTKIAGYLAVDPTNVAEVQSALWLFENLIIGLELPDTYTNPFPSASGFTWGPGKADPSQGHCIMANGYIAQGLSIDTWALEGTFTYSALAALCSASEGGELWVMLTPDQIAKAASKAPNGFAWQDLVVDFDSIGGSVVIPTPTPTPVIPPAPAGSIVSLAQAQGWVSSGLSGGFPFLTRAQAIASANAALAKNWPSS
jgi:hypothetical protein